LAVKWCKDLFASVRDDEFTFDQLIALAEGAPAGSDGLLFYPYMLGERRPENTAARGGFAGITLNHTAAHFARAVMEGVALTMGMDFRLFSDLGVPIERLLCVGGGTRNALWNQIKADVTNMPLELSDEPEAGLKGAALLGAAGVGLVDDLTAAARQRCITTQTVQPVADQVAVYEQSLAEFSRLYDHMLGFWQRMDTMLEDDGRSS